MAPDRVAGVGGPSQSSSASGVFFQADGQSPATRNSILVNGQSGLGTSSREMNSGTNAFSPSIGASSLVTDDNSALSGPPRFQRSTSINNESCAWLPASPMSLPNNISRSSVMDGSSLMQQGQHQHPEQLLVQGASGAPLQLAMAQEPDIPFHAPKKLRLDMGQQGNTLQMLQRQEALQMQGRQNPQLLVITQQQRQLQWPQPQRILQYLPQMQHVQLHPQLQQPRHTIVALPIRYVSERGLCARRLMQYMYHQRHRLPDNSIVYWKKFVAEYFARQAKKRWCFALCVNGGNHDPGAFPEASKDSWQCGICGSKSGKGFEATFEVLPRLCQMKFDSGVIDEILFIDMPHEFRLPTGMMVLEYAKAVRESVYEQARVVHEGQLRIIFAPDLKILSWDFCVRRLEEFVPCQLVAPQVNQLLQAAQNFEAAVNESGSTGVSLQDTKTKWNMSVYTSRQLAKSLDMQSLNDWRLPKGYMRCGQIAEVVNSMKDLINFSHEHKIGPIESLKNYPQHAAAKHQTNKTLQVEQLMTSHTRSNQSTATGILNNTGQNGSALNNHQYLPRTSANPNQNALQADTLCTFGGPNQAQSMPSQSHVPSTLVSPSVNGSLNHHQQQSP